MKRKREEKRRVEIRVELRLRRERRKITEKEIDEQTPAVDGEGCQKTRAVLQKTVKRRGRQRSRADRRRSSRESQPAAQHQLQKE